MTEIVFDKGRTRDDLEKLKKILERLIAAAPIVTKGGFDPAYLDRKVRLLQHLLAGLVARIT